jgi:hypothetical protein
MTDVALVPLGAARAARFSSAIGSLFQSDVSEVRDYLCFVFVSGHDFSRAVRAGNQVGFSP